MLNKNNNMYKIAVIDKEKAIYSILDEQKEFFINYTWFHFKSIKKFTEIKNKEIKKYFDNQPKNSFISVEGAANQIQKELPKGIIIGETIIYNRLKDKSFNQTF